MMGRVLHDVFNRQHLLLDEIADRYFAPDYRQRTNGSWSRRAEVVDHLARVREVAERADIVVEEELSQGRLYADRHVVRVHKRGGASRSRRFTSSLIAPPTGGFGNSTKPP